MNVTFAQLSTKSPPRSGRRLVQMFAAAFFVLFLTVVPALADEVRIGQVVTTLSNSRANPELKLSSQDPVAPGTKGSTQNGPANGNQGAQKPDQGANGSVVNVSGVAIINEGASLGVDIIEEGDVEGTICDCGEVFVAGGAFPKWPFLFLGAVPLVFINDCCDDNTTSSPTPTPTPTPPSTPTPTPPTSEVPEPASLLLFGTGLAAFGAGLRHRYAKAKLSKQINAQEKE